MFLFHIKFYKGMQLLFKNLRDLIYDLQWFDKKKMTLLTTFL
jgi:hypothetical protein